MPKKDLKSFRTSEEVLAAYIPGYDCEPESEEESAREVASDALKELRASVQSLDLG